MKKIAYILSVAVLMILSACSDDDIFYEAEAYLEVTSTQVWLDAGGETKSVSIATNQNSWVCDEPPGWLDLERDGGQLILSAGANDSDAANSVYLNLTAGNLTATIYVRQPGTGYSDLSAGGTANCYIAGTDRSYRFDARIKGNGNTEGDGNSRYIELHGLEIEDAMYADLLWEATLDGDKTRSNHIIEGAVSLKDGYVYFSTGRYEGNASIGVKNHSGEILWSWHIWVRNDEVRESEANGYIWMDRNLGAENNNPGDLRNRGMHYQWGRKDPFLPSMGEYDPTMTVTAPPFSNIQNYQTGKGSSEWIYEEQVTVQHAEAPGNIPLSIRNPTVFLLAHQSPFENHNTQDWYLTLANEAQMNSALWGRDDTEVVKSIFDPCPPGYRVPDYEAFATENGRDQTKDWSERVSNGFYWTEGNGDYFPMGGIRGRTTGLPTTTGALGCYLTNSASMMANSLYVFYSYVVYGNYGKSFGYSVRCVKE